MKINADECYEKPEYKAPKVLASYDKEELDDTIGVNNEVEGQSGGGCGCGCGCGIIDP